MTHPFEKAGFGTAPFRCTHVSENVFGMPDGSVKAGGCCDYCGTGLRYEFWIKGSGAGEKLFKVGCDCVAKTRGHVENFAKVRADHTKARRQEGAEKRAEKKREARKAWIDEQHANRAIERAEATKVWREANSALAARLDAYTGTNDFLLSMIERLGYWGTLSEKQAEAAESCFATIARLDAARATSQHIGAVGDKVTVTLTINRLVILEGHYGTTFIYICEDKSGNTVVYKGTSSTFAFTPDGGPRGKGHSLTVKATVKDHTEYQGVKQTLIQRPKVLEEALG
jgi:hypothetical protein